MEQIKQKEKQEATDKEAESVNLVEDISISDSEIWDLDKDTTRLSFEINKKKAVEFKEKLSENYIDASVFLRICVWWFLNDTENVADLVNKYYKEKFIPKFRKKIVRLQKERGEFKNAEEKIRQIAGNDFSDDEMEELYDLILDD